jgi:hypothetical protein
VCWQLVSGVCVRGCSWELAERGCGGGGVCSLCVYSLGEPGEQINRFFASHRPLITAHVWRTAHQRQPVALASSHTCVVAQVTAIVWLAWALLA